MAVFRHERPAPGGSGQGRRRGGQAGPVRVHRGTGQEAADGRDPVRQRQRGADPALRPAPRSCTRARSSRPSRARTSTRTRSSPPPCGSARERHDRQRQCAPRRQRRFVSKPEFSILLILVAMLGLTAVLQKNFFEMKSVVRNINAFTPLVLLTMGQAVVIISGGIDLSTGTALSLLTCVLTTVMQKADPVTGRVCHAGRLRRGHGHRASINGIGIGYLRIPPVIVTFATSFIWLGAALFLGPPRAGNRWPGSSGSTTWAPFPTLQPSVKAFGAIIPPALILVLIGCRVLGLPRPDAHGQVHLRRGQQQ